MSSATRGRLRRLNLQTSLPPLVLAAVVLVAVDTHAWWHVPLLAVNALAALVAFERWTAEDLSRVVRPCLLVTGVLWPVGALLTHSPNAYWGICVVGSLALARTTRHRDAGAVALILYVGAIGWAAGGDRAVFVYIPVAVTALVIVASVVGERFYDVVRELEQSREREAELAVIRERVRFAGDLHDIQGHTLHVVKLKAALAGKLVRDDPERAAEELREIQELVGQTITQTKELAYAQRRLNLSAELENAKNLFEAAGIRVRITRAAEVDAHATEILGHVLRETTTNILRHAQATRVRITLSAYAMTIVNDGAGDSPRTPSGLATLRRRLESDGGSLTVTQQDGEFVTAAAVRADVA
jgi:two-component system, NarL family, sensor histidine kinase DesK